MRLLCDEMLAGLARWLRAAGHDAALGPPQTSDRALVALAKSENRLLLTRDRTLPHLAPERVMLLPEPLEAQVALLAHRLGLNWREAPFSRCLVDNTPLVPASAAALATLPQRLIVGPPLHGPWSRQREPCRPRRVRW